jgi:hypothetical protein
MPANPERGEVDLQVGDRSYVLKLSMNAAATLEKKLGRSLGSIMVAANSLEFTAIRTIVWLLLQRYHAADFKTEEQAGDLIDDVGGVAPFFDVLNKLGQVNQPDQRSGGDAAHPPGAQPSGTGDNSTPTPVASA